MRTLLGLAALAAIQKVSAQLPTISADTNTGSLPSASQIGSSPLASIGFTSSSPATTITPAGQLNSGTPLVSSNWGIILPYTVSSLVFSFTTNQFTGQIEYRWNPGYSSGTAYTCDPCSGGPSLTSCSTSTGPGTSPSPVVGFNCASFTRHYTFGPLVQSTPQNTQIINSFSVQLFDINTNPAPNTSSYSFQVVRSVSPIIGDPMIYGIQGQDFQVHGVPDEIFNLISAPSLQVNARFVYLSEGECHDNFTACFAHPGTYISEEGIRVGHDKIHVKAGSFAKGLTVKINGQKITKKVSELKHGSVELVNHRRVVIKTDVATIGISNSDKFLNQETGISDLKLIDLGRQRRKLLVGESFHSEVPLHGLQGQTWRNVEYPSGLEYEGTITDYQIADGNLFGSDFVFNKYKMN